MSYTGGSSDIWRDKGRLLKPVPEQGPAPDLFHAEPLRQPWEAPVARPCLCSLCVLCIAHTQSSAACGTSTPPLGAPQLLLCWPGSQRPSQIPRVAPSSTWLLLAQPSEVGPHAGQHCRLGQSEVALGYATAALKLLTD